MSIEEPRDSKGRDKQSENVIPAELRGRAILRAIEVGRRIRSHQSSASPLMPHALPLYSS